MKKGDPAAIVELAEEPERMAAGLEQVQQRIHPHNLVDMHWEADIQGDMKIVEGEAALGISVRIHAASHPVDMVPLFGHIGVAEVAVDLILKNRSAFVEDRKFGWEASEVEGSLT